MFALVLLAGAAGAGHAPLSAGLAPFAPVAGSCWTTRIDADTQDVHCFEPLYGGKHLRDRHRVLAKGRAVYEGETLYSFDGQDIVFTYVNSLGGVGSGTARGERDGVSFAMTMRAAPGSAPARFATRWEWQRDGYTVSTEGQPLRRFVRAPSPRGR